MSARDREQARSLAYRAESLIERAPETSGPVRDAILDLAAAIRLLTDECE